jgi:hypothetical protein
LADALIVYSLAPEPGIGQILVLPDDILIVPPSTEIPFKVKALDSFGNPLPLPEEAVSVEILEGDGRIEGLRYIAPKKPGDSLLRFHVRGESGEHYSEKFIHAAVYVREPARMVVSPSFVLLEPGQSKEFQAIVLDKQGDPIRVDKERIQWSLEGRFGVISPDGQLLTRSGGSGKVSARFGRLTGEAEVYVGKITSRPIIQGGEIEKWKLRVPPKTGIEAAIAPLESEDMPACRLTYNFGQREGGEIAIERTAPLEGEPYGLRLWIRGDGNPVTARCLVEDKKRRLFSLPLPEADRRNTEWREIIVPFVKTYLLEGNRRAKMAYPVSFEGFRISRSAGLGVPTGTIALGPVEVLYLDME